jgi:hypothetical protein
VERDDLLLFDRWVRGRTPVTLESQPFTGANRAN